ncbi:hypothetical protein OMP38_22530 [Cohnella ginsengisoli]|uniref:Uncharacterized protein n=1 Tax=Cohnella ginsengisoli TaxID=425004 RepID=A0A9X4KKY6_9BACL|nr:hypothetical protein [Cohnella ginsengisoli]MDG0793314.1 hypothetical protein [Cohnella ginsengisoli]
MIESEEAEPSVGLAAGEADAEGEEEAEADAPGEGAAESEAEGEADGEALGVAAGVETDELAGAVPAVDPEGPPQPARSAIAAADMATARSD